MNPSTNHFEELSRMTDELSALKDEERRVTDRELQKKFDDHTGLVRPDGSPVPKTWSVFTVGELVVIKDYTFKVGHISESTILFEPVGPVIVGNKETTQ